MAVREIDPGELSEQAPLIVVGLLLPLALLSAFVLGGLLLVAVLATGLIVGRWWAPVSFVVAFPISILSNRDDLSSPEWIAWTTMMATMEALGLAAVCLVGVGIRVLIARSSGQLRDRPA